MPSIKVRGLPPPQDHGHTAAGDGGALGSEVVDTSQIKDGALSANAAGRAKMADGFVQLAKVESAVKSAMYHGDEVEVQVTGTTEEQVKDLAIVIDPTNALALKTLKIVARLKSTTSSQASLKIYHDGGGTPDLTLTSTSATYEEKSGTIDVSGWGTGRHTIEIKLVDDTVGETAYNELLEIYGVQ